MTADPGKATIVAGSCAISLDLRHESDSRLDELDARCRDQAITLAAASGCSVSFEEIWSIDATTFDEVLVEAAREATGGGDPVVSGALHDAASVAKAGVPAAMVFVRSLGGVSHSRAEDSSEEDLLIGIRALARVADSLTGLDLA